MDRNVYCALIFLLRTKYKDFKGFMEEFFSLCVVKLDVVKTKGERCGRKFTKLRQIYCPLKQKPFWGFPAHLVNLYKYFGPKEDRNDTRWCHLFISTKWCLILKIYITISTFTSVFLPCLSPPH